MTEINLTEFPEYLTQIDLLERLDLSFNKITSIPESIGRLINLKKLKLDSNELSNLPNSIRNLNSLEIVSLFKNKFEFFPDIFCNLNNLKKINLRENRIEKLPKSLKNLKDLKEFNLSKNYFRDFPSVLTDLKSLEILNLGSNWIMYIPDSISNLTNLRELILDDNRGLKTLPDSISLMNKLILLSLEDDYVVKLPESLKKAQKMGLSVKGASDIKYDEYGSFELKLSLRLWQCPSVISYEREKDRNELLNPNEIIINEQKIWILFDYPLSVKVKFEFENQGGYSRMDIFRCIYEGYKNIYEEEEKEVGDPGSAPNLMNRAMSYGKFGIWGHYMGELYIESVHYNKSSKTIKLGIGS